MESLRLRVVNTFCSRVLRPRLAATPTPEAARADFERLTRLFLVPPRDLRVFQDETIDWASVGAPREGGVVLYFHGGAYIAGSPRTHRVLAGRLAMETGLRVGMARYPLAPEMPAPAAFEAARAAHEGLLAAGHAPRSIVLGGDSAGGGLALALLADCCARGVAPAGLFAFSPWTDLTGSGASLIGNAGRDRLLDPRRLEEVVGYVTSGGLPAGDPRLSPLHARFASPPPVWLSVSGSEILLDDTRRMCARLRAAGGTVEVEELPDAPHVWPLFDTYLPEARATIASASAFARGVLGIG